MTWFVYLADMILIAFLLYVVTEMVISEVCYRNEWSVPYRLALFFRFASYYVSGDWFRRHLNCHRCGVSHRLYDIHTTIYDEWTGSTPTGQQELFPNVWSQSSVDVLCEHCHAELPIERQLLYIVPHVERLYADPIEKDLIYQAVLAGK